MKRGGRTKLRLVEMAKKNLKNEELNILFDVISIAVMCSNSTSGPCGCFVWNSRRGDSSLPVSLRGREGPAIGRER